MSNEFFNELERLKKKKKKDDKKTEASTKTSEAVTSGASIFLKELDRLGYDKPKPIEAKDNTAPIEIQPKTVASDEDIAPAKTGHTTDIAPTKNVVETTQEIYDKWGKYYNESDYDEYSKKGAAIENPSYDDAKSWMKLFNYYIGGKRVANKATFGRENKEHFAQIADIAGVNESWVKDWKLEYLYMTDFEVGIYNYLLAKNGEDSAQEFLDDIESTLVARKGIKSAERIQNIDNDVNRVLNYANTSLASGLESSVTGIKQLFSEDALPTTDMEVANQILLEGLDGKAKELYQAGNVIGNMLPSVAVGLVNPEAGRILQSSSAAGNAYRQSLIEGKTKEEAATFGVIMGGMEWATSKLLSGISGTTGSLPEKALAKIATLGSAFLRTTAKYTINLASEITEEEFQLWLERAARWIVFGEDFDAPSAEEMAETLFVTAISTGVLNLSTDIATGNLTKVNGLNKYEARVIEAEVENRIAAEEADGKKVTGKQKNEIREAVIEDMANGQLGIDTIESTLGGKTYEEYKNLTEKEDALNSRKKEIENEISSLVKTPESQFTVEQRERLTSLREEAKGIKGEIKALDTKGAKSRLSDEVFGIAKNSRLAETYAERARRGQAFEADLSQYKNEKQRAAIERAIKSGVLNNTYRAHQLVDTLSRIEADKGIAFDYTNNEKLKKSGFAVDGKIVNGYVKDGGVTLNVNSAKAWQSTVGHEITHVLEGTEVYDELKSALFTYAESRGELAGRKAALTELYKNVKDADIESELTADLVGDYLFTNEDFVNKLTGNQTLFQKIWDEVKYLCKIATGKELTEIEKVEREFARAWKEYGKAESADAPAPAMQFSVSEETDSDNSLTGIDKYSQKQYNSFGWARDTGAITKNELDDMYSKIQVKPSLKAFPQSSYGEAIVEVNDNPHATLGTNNVFAFVTGTKNNPQISRVIRFKAETETEMEIIKEKLYERGTFSYTYYSFLEQYGIAREYSKKGALDYLGYKEKARRGSGGTESGAAYGNGRNEQNRSGTFAEAQANDIAPIKEVSSTGDAFFDGKKPVKYSISPALNSDLDAVLNGTFDASKGEVYLGETSNFMTEVIGAESLKVTMPASKAYAALVTREEYERKPYYTKHPHYHGIGKEDFIEILEKSENPIAAFAAPPDEDGNTRYNRIVLVTDKVIPDVEKGGVGNAIVIEEVDTNAIINKKRFDVNKTITVYPKAQVESDINRAIAENRIFDIKTKKDQVSAGVQGSNSQAAIRKTDLTNNIARFWANVKWENSKNKIFSAEAPGGITAMQAALMEAGYDPDGNTQSMQESENDSKTKQSLSSAADTDIAPTVGYATPMSEIRYQAPADANIAPVREDMRTNEGTTATIDTAPLTFPGDETDRTVMDGDIGPAEQAEEKSVEKSAGETKTARVLTESQSKEHKKRGLWSFIKEYVLDNGMVFEEVAKKTNNRELEAKWNSIRNAGKMAQFFIGRGKNGIRAVNDIRAEVEKRGLQEPLFNYLYHMHNIDRMSLEERGFGANKAVFGDNITADISRAEAKRLLAENPTLRSYAEEIYANNRYLRQLMVDEGLITQEVANLWEEMYPHYVPIGRSGATGMNINVPLDTHRTGINSPVKRAKGGNGDIDNLFDTLGTRAMQTYRAIAKNRFGVELKNTLGTVFDANEASIDDAMAMLDQTDSLLKQGENGTNPTFTVFEGGERVTYEITEEMYDALKPTGDILSYTIKPFNAASNIFRALLTEYNPVFTLTNAIKDAQDVLVNSQHAAKTYATIPRALVQMATGGKYYTEYLAGGGEQNTYFDNESSTYKKENKALEIAKTALGLNAISKANQIIEMAPRLAEYIASRESGRSIDVSMLDAARVTTNFAAGGKLTKLLNRNGVTFLSASVNGAVQQARNLVEAKQNGVKGVMGLAAKFLVAGLPVTLLNGLIWDDDEEYEELSDYVKQNYYIVGKYGDGKFVRIPKGRTVAVIQNAFEQMEHLVTGDDEADLRTFLELAVSNLAPNNPLENNIFAPIKQVMDNKTWYGDDLVPQRLQDLPAAEQYDESTDSLSRWIGETFNVSPYKVNYLLDQYSGGVGDIVLPMLTPEAESGDDSIAGQLLAPLRSKFTTDSVMNNQNVSDFYDTKDELTVTAKGRNATDEEMLSSKYMNSLNSEISKLYGEKREIQASDLPDSEKYEQVRAIQSKIVALTKEALDAYDDISYDGDYANIGNRYYKRDDDGEWQKLSDDQVTKYKVTSAAGDAPYATDGNVHYRYYVKEGENEGTWQKLDDKELEKQKKVTKGLGITPEEYWGKKAEYDYAYENPEKYAVAKSVGGYEAYKGYSGDLYDIKADKDASGKSISGSRKNKVVDYINNLDLDYGMKLILFKNEYNADDSYDDEIVEYLIGRDDISYEDKVTIFKELGFTVSADGTVSW